MSENVNRKIIYCVRHGQTVGNLRDAMQGLDDPLTPEGDLQAEKVAERTLNLEFDAFISSDATRAVQTATIISKRTGRAFETSALFRERKAPTSLIGITRAEEAYKPYDIFRRKNLGKNEHFEDEENFFDLRERGLEALKFLEEHSESKILIVTHGLFLRMLTTLVILDKKLELEQWRPIYFHSMKGSNTGLTIFECIGNQWTLVTWNDHAHLG